MKKPRKPTVPGPFDCLKLRSALAELRTPGVVLNLSFSLMELPVQRDAHYLFRLKEIGKCLCGRPDY